MVMYNSTHNGHAMEIKHVPLSASERQQIAAMISKGISFKEILNRVRSNTSATEISRLQLITLRDLRNIVASLRSDSSINRKTFDSENVRCFVEKCRREQPEMIRFIKFQGEVATGASMIGSLKLVDFMIVLMNEVQVQKLQRCGPNRIVCMDYTHEIKASNFHLIMLIVIDDSGEGFPVAFCISSNVDRTAMEVFLETVRTGIGGCIDNAILMSDDSPASLVAWTNVMGAPDHHVQSSWDVDRNWRTNLAKGKLSQEDRTKVCKMLRTLLEADTKEQFHELLESCLHNMATNDALAEFLSYFKCEFVSKPELWAHSYLRDLHSHHVGHLEEFHRTLKNVFMDGKKVRPLDQSLIALLRLLRFKTFERVIKQDKWKISQHVCDISKRHALSESLTNEQIVVGEQGDCLVHDEHGDYIINKTSAEDLHRLHSSDAILCPLVCNVCNVCVHTVTCTCMDYELRNTVCVHIHAVVQQYGIISIDTDTETVAVESDIYCNEHSAIEHDSDQNLVQLAYPFLSAAIIGNQLAVKYPSPTQTSVQSSLISSRTDVKSVEPNSYTAKERPIVNDSVNRQTVLSAVAVDVSIQPAVASRSTAETEFQPLVTSPRPTKIGVQSSVAILHSAMIDDHVQPSVSFLISTTTGVQSKTPVLSDADNDVRPADPVFSPSELTGEVKTECVCSSDDLTELDDLWKTIRRAVVDKHRCNLLAIAKDGLRTIATNIISAKKD